jgi:pimeloyl-ACP methyl ester carboxylesterase
VYGGVGNGLRGAARSGATLAARRADSDAPSLASRPVASLVLGALNGFYGNHLVDRGNELALQMQIWRDGAQVAPTEQGLAAGFADASSRLVVFVHGLCETEVAWTWGPSREGEAAAKRRTYGDRLQDELGFTPIYVRYNTGLHVSDNGRRLASLLDALTQAWPASVDELVLVGHSMGGLVARSACHYGEKDGLAFADSIRHVFCLGTPHLGADLEKGANALAWALNRLPETKPIATFLNARSAGIKDLRYGSCVEEDWCDCDPDEFLQDRCQEVPFLPDANYYFIGAALRPTVVGNLLGDLLVRMPSASGRGTGKGRRIPFEVDNGHELPGLTHFHLLNHPAVYEQLRTWLTRQPAAAMR